MKQEPPYAPTSDMEPEKGDFYRLLPYVQEPLSGSMLVWQSLSRTFRSKAHMVLDWEKFDQPRAIGMGRIRSQPWEACRNRTCLDLQSAQRMAQYPKIESIGSMGSMILVFL